MERQFYVNWSLLVEEAKQRRKAQRLTQARLARLAGVSTPTVSRFESQETDIQLPTVLSILGVLGMIDRRMLVFTKPTARYDASRMVVDFIGKDGDKRIACAISREALEDHFRADGKDVLKVFAAHRLRIEQAARRKYLADKGEIDGSILLKTEDF
jgi:transcriptional regulator with XRE-family HTH domain